MFGHFETDFCFSDQSNYYDSDHPRIAEESPNIVQKLFFKRKQKRKKRKEFDRVRRRHIYKYGEHDDKGAMVGIKNQFCSSIRALGCLPDFNLLASNPAINVENSSAGHPEYTTLHVIHRSSASATDFAGLIACLPRLSLEFHCRYS